MNENLICLHIEGRTKRKCILRVPLRTTGLMFLSFIPAVGCQIALQPEIYDRDDVKVKYVFSGPILARQSLKHLQVLAAVEGLFSCNKFALPLHTAISASAYFHKQFVLRSNGNTISTLGYCFKDLCLLVLLLRRIDVVNRWELWVIFFEHSKSFIKANVLSKFYQS